MPLKKTNIFLSLFGFVKRLSGIIFVRFYNFIMMEFPLTFPYKINERIMVACHIFLYFRFTFFQYVSLCCFVVYHKEMIFNSTRHVLYRNVVSSFLFLFYCQEKRTKWSTKHISFFFCRYMRVFVVHICTSFGYDEDRKRGESFMRNYSKPQNMKNIELHVTVNVLETFVK